MSRVWAAGAALVAAGTAVWLGAGTATGDGRPPVAPANASWTTVFASPISIEGLTTGPDRALYVAQRAPAGSACPVVRVEPNGGARQAGTVVATMPAPCNPAGLTFGPDDRLYLTGAGTAGDQIAAVTPDASAPPAATIYATGTPGANGLVFDRAGNLYTTDGGTNQGRVFRVGPAGGAASELFRVPPMANALGVGRSNQSLQPTSTGLPPAAQNIVANGIVVTDQRTLLVADTARGALWQVPLSRSGRVLARTGCDTTFTANTLCLDALLVEHPVLEGADGIALDRRGNVFADANERNAIGVVDRRGRVSEFFRSPVSPEGLRNAGPLEFPTSPVLAGRTLCTTNSDGNRRDNAPSTAGAAAPGTAVLGTITCLDQRVG